MIKSKELVGPSCLTAATDDEPIFVLRANDELASSIVRVWAQYYCVAKGVFTEVQRQKYSEALALADQMDRWRLRAAIANAQRFISA